MSMIHLRVISFLAFVLLGAVGSASAQTNITFYAISDTHYGQKGMSGTLTMDSARSLMPGLLNALPGTPYPAIFGGNVAVPRAVLIAGDLIHIIDTTLWNQYAADYGINGEKKLYFPTLESLGNHDFFATGPLKDTLHVVNRMIQRNIVRRPLFANMDSTGYHYSWDWDGVHFVNLNLYAGGTERSYDDSRPLGALQFLQQDLLTQVGASGRPVFIMQHFPLRDDTYFPSFLRTRLANALKNYNVIGILHGHSHSKAIYKWAGAAGDSIDVFDDGAAMNGDMMVFHITDGRMRAIARSYTTWSTTVLLDKTISMGASVNPAPSDTTSGLPPVPPPTNARGADGYRHILFSIPSAGWNQVIPARVKRLEIVNLRGEHVRLLRAANGRVEWNRRDAKGRRAPAGIYAIREAGKVGALGKFVLR